MGVCQWEICFLYQEYQGEGEVSICTLEDSKYMEGSILGGRVLSRRFLLSVSA